MKLRFRKIVQEAVLQGTADFPADVATIPRVRRILNSIMNRWYTDGGGSYYFLFRKNLSVTNVSFPELTSLLRYHGHPQTSDLSQPIQFLSSRRLKVDFNLSWGIFTYIGDDENTAIDIDALTDFWYEIFATSILFDSFHGSAVVHIPATLKLDLAAVCGEAGFIYACGEAVYIRRTEKAAADDLRRNLTKFLDAHSEKMVLFVPYSHEYFDIYDVIDTPELVHGLADVKLHLDKLFLGSTPLASVLRNFRKDFQDRIYIPDGIENYDEQRKAFYKEEHANTNLSLWLLLESSVREENSKLPGEKLYYVCYAQRYRNANPFIGFDESKPGWVSPVTLPHTLAAAMLNLTRLPAAGKRQPTVAIVDPFAGTGTTFLEALKLPGTVEFLSGDLNPISQIIISDNVQFFSMEVPELTALEEFIQSAKAAVSDVRYPVRPRVASLRRNAGAKELYAWALNMVAMQIGRQEIDEGTNGGLLRDLHSHLFGKGFFRAFSSTRETFRQRLLFYLVWRAFLRNWFSLGEQQGVVAEPVTKEFGAFLHSLRRLKEVREQQVVLSQADTMTVQAGDYSPDCVISAERIRTAAADHKICIGDAVTLLSERVGKFDVVVTDPPYNFNATVQEVTQLLKLYARVIPAMVRSLKPEGQMVFCLPDMSRNGQQIPLPFTKEIIVHQVLRAAGKEGRQAFLEAWVKPHPYRLFRAPFYWQSERALARSILHFHLRTDPLTIC